MRRDPLARPDFPYRRPLIFLPLGLLAASVVFDLIDLATGTEAFNRSVYWMIATGVCAGVLAGLAVLVHWRRLPAGSDARRVGARHVAGQAAVLVLFALSWQLRLPEAPVPGPALWLSLAGAAVAAPTAWLGRRLLQPLDDERFADPGAAGLT